jgi:hypothetical protein
LPISILEAHLRAVVELEDAKYLLKVVAMPWTTYSPERLQLHTAVEPQLWRMGLLKQHAYK